MTNYNFSDSVIALAAISQAIYCVKDISRKGQTDPVDMEIMIESLLKTDADSTEEIYKNHKYLTTGLRFLVEQLSGPRTDAEFSRYLVNILSLQKRFSNDANMQKVMGSRVAQAKRLYEYQEKIDQDLIEQLAHIYKDTISTYPTKIQVSGNSQYLQQSANQAKIRALLLSAIRAAVLWHQVGGKKRHFLLSKNKIIETAKAYLA
ncbi:high frequency lysogenization protein HflD [Kangiella sediminilitoris]|uniref:High frequency lysogenization protein HflD homolog n=1 Tax=Kangiella sediminilitoris TaxID=1144748 RepID=A0A1B3BB30_9GAMM|nr:high frequency lysogenization protein HflD [Kangiella sediminilitoris]AOE49976.1 High frequency lysogenization protein HflD-like protein [Kangiella sediminilitoris]